MAKIKPHGRALAVAGIVVLSSTASFGLGRIAKISTERQPLAIEVGESVATTTPSTPKPNPPRPATADQGGKVVASKSGTRYYLPTCSGVSRIKEANKVWFTSPAEAERAGYTRAANC